MVGLLLAISVTAPLPGFSQYELAFVIMISVSAATASGLGILGVARWREDRSLMEGGTAIAFAALPVFGLLVLLCVSDTARGLNTSVACGTLADGMWWVLVWVLVWFGVAILSDFLSFLRSADSTKRA